MFIVFIRGDVGPGISACVMDQQVGGLLGQVRLGLPAVRRQRGRAVQRHHETLATIRHRVSWLYLCGWTSAVISECISVPFRS